MLVWVVVVVFPLLLYFCRVRNKKRWNTWLGCGLRTMQYVCQCCSCGVRDRDLGPKQNQNLFSWSLFSFHLTPAPPVLPAPCERQPGLRAAHPTAQLLQGQAWTRRAIPASPMPQPQASAGPCSRRSSKWNLSLPYYTPPMSKNWAAFLRCFNQPEPQVGLSYSLIPAPSFVQLSHNASQPGARPLVSSTPFRDVSFLTSS